MIDAKRIGDRGLARPGRRIESANLTICQPLAVLHQLCGPMLGELDSLPEQQQALRVACGRWIDDSWPTPARGS